MRQHAKAAIIWTPDGAEKSSETSRETGNLAHVISMADGARIPVFNVKNSEARIKLNQYLNLDAENDKESDTNSGSEYDDF